MTNMNQPADWYRNDLIEFIYNVHKDVYGFKPRGFNFDAMTTNQLGEFADDLVAQANPEPEPTVEELVKAFGQCGNPSLTLATVWPCA